MSRCAERGIDPAAAAHRSVARPAGMVAAGPVRPAVRAGDAAAGGGRDGRTAGHRAGTAGAADLVGAALDALAVDRGLLAAEHARIGLLLVDDVQNLDPQAALLVQVLARGAGATVLAGDPNQAVFRFRGADARRAARRPRAGRAPGRQPPVRPGGMGGVRDSPRCCPALPVRSITGCEGRRRRARGAGGLPSTPRRLSSPTPCGGRISSTGCRAADGRHRRSVPRAGRPAAGAFNPPGFRSRCRQWLHRFARQRRRPGPAAGAGGHWWTVPPPNAPRELLTGPRAG